MSVTEPTEPTETRADPMLVAVERAMIRIRRRQTRRALGRTAAQNQPQLDLHQIAAVDAVDEGTAGGQEGVTVGLVAERLGIDPSRASRVVTAAIQNGYLRRVASQQDGRRICLEVTEQGMAVLQHVHQSRYALYERLLAGWSARDRREFARLLTRFTESLANGDVAL